jgi:hypothetical protein
LTKLKDDPENSMVIPTSIVLTAELEFLLARADKSPEQRVLAESRIESLHGECCSLKVDAWAALQPDLRCITTTAASTR